MKDTEIVPLSERQKLIAQMSAVLIAGQRDPHPSALPTSVRIATNIVEEVERTVHV